MNRIILGLDLGKSFHVTNDYTPTRKTPLFLPSQSTEINLTNLAKINKSWLLQLANLNN